jgi:alkylation response protein AidB-like acyl-CoA dehydrogenase
LRLHDGNRSLLHLDISTERRTVQFGFDEDQLAMRDAVRSFCADRFDLAAVHEREGRPVDEATWQGLVDLGVLGMLEDDSGLGLVEATIVFEELGAHLSTGPLLWSVLAAPLVGGGVKVTGVEVGASDDAPVVVEHAAESEVLVVVRPDRVEVCRPVPPTEDGAPLDPLTPVGVLADLPSGEVVGETAVAERLRREGRVLSAAMLVGAAQGALDVARDYALEREQFGVPIGSFQAIKHMLADMFGRVELARAATYAAAAITVDPAAGDPDRAAATAKVLAGEAGIANGRAAVQILGGMGFTWDMLPHLFLKRSWVLENTFGTASSCATYLAETVPA